jgi:hypothetical protein
MTSITPEFAIESLWNAIEWELPKVIDATAVFDEIAYQLRRSPQFKGMSIAELDLILADAKRQFQFRTVNLEWAIVRAFKDQIGFDDEAAA